MAADVAEAARRARPGERRGGTVTEHDLRLVLRLAKRAGALEVRVGGMTIMFARDAGKHSALCAGCADSALTCSGPSSGSAVCATRAHCPA